MSLNANESVNSTTKSVWPIFIVGLGMIALFWGATEVIRSWIPTGSNEEEVRSAERVKNLQELEETNRKELEGYSWADKAKGVVRIPIERAMDLEVAVLNEKKPTRAYPVQTPAAPAAPVAPVVPVLAVPQEPAPVSPTAVSPEPTPAPNQTPSAAPAVPAAY